MRWVITGMGPHLSFPWPSRFWAGIWILELFAPLVTVVVTILIVKAAQQFAGMRFSPHFGQLVPLKPPYKTGRKTIWARLCPRQPRLDIVPSSKLPTVLCWSLFESTIYKSSLGSFEGKLGRLSLILVRGRVGRHRSHAETVCHNLQCLPDPLYPIQPFLIRLQSLEHEIQVPYCKTPAVYALLIISLKKRSRNQAFHPWKSVGRKKLTTTSMVTSR